MSVAAFTLAITLGKRFFVVHVRPLVTDFEAATRGYFSFKRKKEGVLSFKCIIATV